MKLYHGSPVPGITQLDPARSSDGQSHVFLTHSDALAVLYAHNPLTRPNGWFPYYWDREGNLHYDEYFPGATVEIYGGQGGWVYTCEGDYPHREDMPWVYLADQPVPVLERRFIPDIYQELLELERAGRLTITRYETLSEQGLAFVRRIIQREIGRLREHPNEEYAAYIHAHFPDLL